MFIQKPWVLHIYANSLESIFPILSALNLSFFDQTSILLVEAQFVMVEPQVFIVILWLFNVANWKITMFKR